MNLEELKQWLVKRKIEEQSLLKESSLIYPNHDLHEGKLRQIKETIRKIEE